MDFGHVNVQKNINGSKYGKMRNNKNWNENWCFGEVRKWFFKGKVEIRMFTVETCSYCRFHNKDWN